MQKQTSIYIPKPCHEDWNKMTPTQQGKFCSACNKQVVDFSLMSDNQVLNFLSNQSGKTCGRFDTDQLQRPLVETKIKKKKSWWMALTMPLLFLFEKSEAQNISSKQKHRTVQIIDTKNILVGDVEPIIVADTIQPTIDSGFKEQLTGKVAICEPPKQITITGKVVDEKNNSISGASIIQKGSKNATITNDAGKFSLSVNSYEDTVTIVAMSIEYESVEKKLAKLEQSNENLTMQLNPMISGEVVVVGLAIKHKPVNRIDTIKTTIKKILKTPDFKIYPNPIIRGSNIHLEIKQRGNYQMQLLDNQSRLIKAEEINTDAEKSTTQIQLPSNIATGIYYLRLINERTKKSYTEKLIIQ